MAAYRAEEVVRKVVQMLTLDRLAARDLVTARLLLLLMAQSGHWAFRSAVPEYAPFAYSLAGADLLLRFAFWGALRPAKGRQRRGSHTAPPRP